MAKKTKQTNKKSKFLLGTALGLGLGLLFAPKSGKETRKDIKEKISEFNYSDLKENFQVKIKEVESNLKDLNKEKVLGVAKTKSKEIEKKVNNLVKELKKEAKPKYDKAADNLKAYTTKTLKNIIEKLEKKE